MFVTYNTFEICLIKYLINLICLQKLFKIILTHYPYASSVYFVPTYINIINNTCLSFKIRIHYNSLELFKYKIGNYLSNLKI